MKTFSERMKEIERIKQLRLCALAIAANTGLTRAILYGKFLEL